MTAPDRDRVTLSIDGAVATITLNRPEKLGALTLEMLHALDDAADTIDRDDAVRVALLTGTGPRAFCAGADIAAWGGLDPLEMGTRWIRDGHRTFDRLAALRQPLIAVLNGITFGGGLELALAADIRVAETHVTLGLPEVTIGAIPGWAGTVRLPELIGAGRARQMIFTGTPIDAATAERWGLVNEVVPTGEGLARGQELAARIAQQAPRAVQVAKLAIAAGLGAGAGAALDSIAAALLSGTRDGREGVAAFRERRPPVFQGL